MTCLPPFELDKDESIHPLGERDESTYLAPRPARERQPEIRCDGGHNQVEPTRHAVLPEKAMYVNVNRGFAYGKMRGEPHPRLPYKFSINR